MDTGHLKAFLKIAETGSISRAAESLGIAQPSLSQQLLRLEDELGLRLFDRTARGVTLTEGGRVFRERARQILHAADQAIADARQLRDEAPGQVIFAMPPSVARLAGVPLVTTLAERAPRLRVRIVEAYSGAIRGWLEAEKIDLGILYDLGPFRHLAMRRLASEELVLVGPPGRFGDTPLPLAALADEVLIAPGPQHGLRQLLDREAARAGIEIEVRYEVDSQETSIGLAAAGQGLAVLPVSAVAPEVAAGRVTMAPFAGDGLRRRLSLARNPSHVLTHASVRVEHALIDVMTAAIAAGTWTGKLERE